MRIGNVNNNQAFGMRIKQNDELDALTYALQIQRGYSPKKIEGIMDSIKKMADDSYEFEVNSVNVFGTNFCYSVSTDNEDAIVDERGDVCSTGKFFMLRNIRKLCNQMVRINNNAVSSDEIYEHAGK